MCMGHAHSSPSIESQGHRSRSRVRVIVSKNGNAVGLTSILDRGQLPSFTSNDFVSHSTN